MLPRADVQQRLIYHRFLIIHMLSRRRYIMIRKMYLISNLRRQFDEKILLKKFESAMETRSKRSLEIDVANTDRALGTLLGAEITRRFDDKLDDDTYTVKCNGAGGQSLVHLFLRDLHLSLSVIVTITLVRDFQVESLLYIHQQEVLIRKTKISSSVMLHYMVLQVVRRSSMVLPEKDSV